MTHCVTAFRETSRLFLRSFRAVPVLKQRILQLSLSSFHTTVLPAVRVSFQTNTDSPLQQTISSLVKVFQWSSKVLSLGFLQRNTTSTVSHICQSKMRRGCDALFMCKDLSCKLRPAHGLGILHIPRVRQGRREALFGFVAHVHTVRYLM